MRGGGGGGGGVNRVEGRQKGGGVINVSRKRFFVN